MRLCPVTAQGRLGGGNIENLVESQRGQALTYLNWHRTPFLPTKVAILTQYARRSYCTGCFLLGTVLFAASLTPTLLPRNFLTQGVLSGCSLAAGYGIGALGSWLWAYMELPQPNARLRVVKVVAAVGCAIIVTVSLWQAAPWQNSIRELMGLKPVDTVHPIEIMLIALATFAILMALARFFLLTLRFL